MEENTKIALSVIIAVLLSVSLSYVLITPREGAIGPPGESIVGLPGEGVQGIQGIQGVPGEGFVIGNDWTVIFDEAWKYESGFNTGFRFNVTSDIAVVTWSLSAGGEGEFSLGIKQAWFDGPTYRVRTWSMGASGVIYLFGSAEYSGTLNLSFNNPTNVYVKIYQLGSGNGS